MPITKPMVHKPHMDMLPEISRSLFPFMCEIFAFNAESGVTSAYTHELVCRPYISLIIYSHKRIDGPSAHIKRTHTKRNLVVNANEHAGVLRGGALMHVSSALPFGVVVAFCPVRRNNEINYSVAGVRSGRGPLLRGRVHFNPARVVSGCFVSAEWRLECADPNADV